LILAWRQNDDTETVIADPGQLHSEAGAARTSGIQAKFFMAPGFWAPG
jgi:hypothetical protein